MSAEFPTQEKIVPSTEALEQTIQQKRQELLTAPSDVMEEIVTQIKQLESEKAAVESAAEKESSTEETVDEAPQNDPEENQERIWKQQLFKNDTALGHLTQRLTSNKEHAEREQDESEKERLDADTRLALLKYNTIGKENWEIHVSKRKHGVEKIEKAIRESEGEEKERLEREELPFALKKLEEMQSARHTVDISNF